MRMLGGGGDSGSSSGGKTVRAVLILVISGHFSPQSIEVGFVDSEIKNRVFLQQGCLSEEKSKNPFSKIPFSGIEI
jgi:hypothetical protein